jgi:2-polyprenyl-3-methyl-5-hydroxy-6-metoxy-1,4-benzoquinol methylase
MLKSKEEDYYKSSRNEVTDLVDQKAQRVLDVGCAFGMAGEALKKRGVREVIGIELNQRAYQEASKRLDRVFLGDVEKLSLPFERGYFDYIIYSDILEHLTDPWSVLKKHRELLRDDGVVIASIPNVQHYRVIKKLLRGSWDYKEKGVLDSTHLRFFTLKSVREMFGQSGYKIDKLVCKLSASKVKKTLNKILRGRLNESLTEQFLIEASKYCKG